MGATWGSDEYWNRAPSFSRSVEASIRRTSESTARLITRIGIYASSTVAMAVASYGEMTQPEINATSASITSLLLGASVYKLGGEFLKIKQEDSFEDIKTERSIGHLDFDIQEGEIDG